MKTPYCKNDKHAYLSKPQYLHLSKGSKVEVTSKSEGLVGSWFEATVLKPPENPWSSHKSKRLALIEYVNLVNEEGTLLLREKVDQVLLRPLPPKFVVEVGDDFREGDLVDCFERDGWWTGIVQNVARVRVGDGNGGDDEKEERYVVEFEDPVHEIEFRKEDLRVHLDWMNGKWFRLRNDVLQELIVTQDGNATLANKSSRSGPEELVEPEHEVVTEISAELPVNEPTTLLDQKLSPCLSTGCQQETVSVECPDNSSTHSLPKKLKGPCVDPFVLPCTKSAELTIEDPNGASRCVAPGVGLRNSGISPLRDCHYKEIHERSVPNVRDSSHFKRGFKRRKTKKQIFVGIPTPLPETEVAEAVGIQKDQTMEDQSHIAVGRELSHEKRGEMQVDENVHKIPCMEEQTRESVGTEMTPEQQGEIQKAENIPRNPPLELEAVGTDVIYEEPGTSNLANEALVPVSEGAVVSPNEGRLGSSGSQVTSQSSPFVKKSPIWKAVEALEMLRLFPQKPHFKPLIDKKERSREGLAIGMMLTYASTVESVIKLSVHSPVSSFMDCLETLRILETHGFDTKTIERRVLKLHSLKGTQEQVDKKKKEVCSRISDLKHKNEKLVEDVYESARKVKFYRQQLTLALLEKEANELEITSLMTSLDVVDTVMESVPFDFVD
ncbi:hypothetical protein MLD38_013667 [Melastoma candidum]|uniref:Uncharacterized protein n=1 Tax=Melastoma candidum TaxID=119954 RepID=A0ACB9RIT1_9MYRT|nr:hypothetical protein MLD38_013667 [Melastoma candidum]